MKTVIPPLCTLCKYYQPGMGEVDDQPRCRAFPEGIPEQIWDSTLDHRESISGETPVFEKAEGVEDAQVVAWAKGRIQFAAAEMATQAGLEPEEDDDAPGVE